MISALQPRTILIEEAAETLEGTVIAGMVDSLQQLILVGDVRVPPLISPAFELLDWN